MAAFPTMKNPFLRVIANSTHVDIEGIRAPTAKIQLFQRERRLGDRVLVDIDTIIQKNTQCFGITGSGKTNTGAMIAEGLLDNSIRVCIFDSAKRDFTSLAADYPQVKIAEFEGKPEEQALLFYNSEDSWVFNTLGKEKAAYVPWMLSFLKTVFKAATDRKKIADAADKAGELPIFIHPIKIFIEEAQEYLPSDISTITNTELRTAIKQLIETVESMHRQGRAYGLSFFIMCQRPTDMITSIRSQTGMYFFHQQTAFIDKDYYVKIIPSQTNKDRQEIRQRVHAFGQGWCYFVVEKESIRAKVMARKTRHSSRDIGLADAMNWRAVG